MEVFYSLNFIKILSSTLRLALLVQDKADTTSDTRPAYHEVEKAVFVGSKGP